MVIRTPEQLKAAAEDLSRVTEALDDVRRQVRSALRGPGQPDLLRLDFMTECLRRSRTDLTAYLAEGSAADQERGLLLYRLALAAGTLRVEQVPTLRHLLQSDRWTLIPLVVNL